jgi:hypothetical protein
MTARDHGGGSDRLGVTALLDMREVGRHYSRFSVEKWDAEQIDWTRRRLDLPPHIEPSARHFEAVRVRPFDVFSEEDCNLITDGGWGLIMNGMVGTQSKYTTAAGRIGGGITNTAAAYTNTDLAATTGAANRQWEMLSSNPTVPGSTQHTTGVVFAATFPTTDGNFAWAEFGIDQGTSAGTGASVATFLNRGVSSPGTKTSAQTWNVSVTITWT